MRTQRDDPIFDQIVTTMTLAIIVELIIPVIVLITLSPAMCVCSHPISRDWLEEFL